MRGQRAGSGRQVQSELRWPLEVTSSDLPTSSSLAETEVQSGSRRSRDWLATARAITTQSAEFCGFLLPFSFVGEAYSSSHQRKGPALSHMDADGAVVTLEQVRILARASESPGYPGKFHFPLWASVCWVWETQGMTTTSRLSLACCPHQHD